MPGLYVHIPFCIKKCRYCDFPSFAGQEGRIPAYLDALAREAALASSPWGVFDTVFVGGGTPSLLSGGEAGALMGMLRSRFAIAPGAEITFECNPGTADEEKLAAYRAAGVNRLSIGLQSMNAALLRRIGRIHDAEAFCRVFRAARAAGFQNINADVMHGLPGQTQADYLDTLRSLAELSPEHISAYGLILEEGTPLFEDAEAGRETLPGEDAVYDMQDAGIAFLEGHGYPRYEISNFAKPGFRCRHNLNYWANGEYLGLGAGAHSAWRLQGKAGPQWTRWNNPAELDAYLARAGEPLGARDLEAIPPAEETFETVMVGLRQTDGVPLAAFERRFGAPLTAYYPQAVGELQKKGWLELTPAHVRLTPKGLDMQNAALQYFLADNGGAGGPPPAPR